MISISSLIVGFELNVFFCNPVNKQEACYKMETVVVEQVAFTTQ